MKKNRSRVSPAARGASMVASARGRASIPAPDKSLIRPGAERVRQRSMLDFVVAPRNLRVIAALGAVVLLSLAVLAPQTTLLVIPLLVAVLAGLLFYEFPVLLAAALILAFGVALDVQVEVLRANSGGGGGTV